MFSASHAPPWIFAADVESEMSYAECERLAMLARGATVLELGAYLGRSTIALASTAAVVHSVDPHKGGPGHASDSLLRLLANLEVHGVREDVVIHVGLSTEVVPRFRAGSFDVVFIDAMHQRPDVDIDLALAVRCLRPGGWIAFHDYGVKGVEVEGTWHAFGVTEAVDEFTARARVGKPDVVRTLAAVRSPESAREPDAFAAWSAAVAYQRELYLE